MPRKAVPQIIVAGDVCLDVIARRLENSPSASAQDNWQFAGERRTEFLPGGALLLADMVTSALTAAGVKAQVTGPQLPRPRELQNRQDGRWLTAAELPRLTREEIVHSLLEVDEVDFKTSQRAIRVVKALGFSGPSSGNPALLPSLPGRSRMADCLVLRDDGNGFRRTPSLWPAQLTSGGGTPLVIYKLRRPLPLSGEPESNALWAATTKRHSARLIVVADADDLRASGVPVSRRMSWERTALDLIWHLKGTPQLVALRRCRHLVVRFGLDGALYWSWPETAPLPVAWLIYDPHREEGDFAEAVPGTMTGFSSAFVAALTACLAGQIFDGEPSLPTRTTPGLMLSAIRQGLGAARALLQAGYEENQGAMRWPCGRIFASAAQNADSFAAINVPIFNDPTRPDPRGWKILDQQLPPGALLCDTAAQLCLRGGCAALRSIPQGVFAKLRTYDRHEIEAYGAISNLLRNYFARTTARVPLSLAVFGPPGSGKSFGVEQVAEAAAQSLAGHLRITKLTFNLSQFRSQDELAAAFHLVRDHVLKGSVPLVFFDEFDATLDRQPLGWLRFFLAPMQDGEFLDRGAVHPIGKSVFVFAGGTRNRFEDFLVLPEEEKSTASLKPAPSMTFPEFRECKGPDFVSRLRGFINVTGIGHPGLDRTAAVLLRRAIMVRLKIQEIAPNLIAPDGVLQVNERIVRAFLQVPRFHHGVRSLTAVLEMSALAGRKHFDASCLPDEEQLKLHVDAADFRQRVLHESLFGEDLDRIARAAHEAFVAARKEDGDFDFNQQPTHREWNKLEESVREDNRRQADEIPAKLRSLGLSFRKVPAEEKPAITEIPPDKVEQLARIEHERWMSAKLMAGWRYGPEKRADLLEHPCLLEWDDPRLAKEQEKDREAVRIIPQLLAGAGYEIVKL